MKGIEEPKPSVPWGIFREREDGPDELMHLGLYPSEKDLWTVFTGWGDADDIKYYTSNGYYAAQLKVFSNAKPTYLSHYRTRSATNRVRT